MKLHIVTDILHNTSWKALLIIALVGSVMPMIVRSGFAIAVLIQFLFFALLGMAWNIIGGYGGQVALGMAQYLGIGAYTTALFLKWWDIPFWVSMPIGVVFAVIWSLIIGYPLFRLKGHYFAIATLAVMLVVQDLFKNWQLVGASRGVQLPLKNTPNLLYLQFTNDVYYYYTIFVLSIVALLYMDWFRRQRLAYQLKSIREDQDLAESLGVNARITKMKAYAIAAAFTSIAGSFYASYHMFIDPDSVMDMLLAVKIALVPMLGGAGTLWGPIIGAAVMVPLDRYLGAFLGGRGLDLVIYGFLIMCIAMFKPEGIWGLVEQAVSARRARH